MNVFDFVQFNSFYEKYNPLTPYGKSIKKRKEIFSSSAELEREYAHTQAAIELINNKGCSTEKIEYHLKRIPKLDFGTVLFDTVDIFEVNKFLVNYKAILGELPKDLKSFYALSFQSENLLALLDKGKENTDSEAFYLSEKYSDTLAEIRSKIREIDVQLKKIKKDRTEEIFIKFGYDFRINDFLVIGEHVAADLDSNHFYREFYDSKNFVVKPVFPKEYFELHAQKEDIVNEEKECEKAILASISDMIVRERLKIEEYIKAICVFDIALAKARIALTYDMRKPKVSSSRINLEIKHGRYPILIEKCAELGTEYQPLTVSFDNRVIVINGSNMGGKTVVLKTLAFFQVLTQMGFYVPAKEFKTTIFNNIRFIGELESEAEKAKGLSSFGLEIFSFVKSYSKDEKSLYFIDEFGRTTNSWEGEALLSSILKNCSKNKNAFVFLSTHFMSLPAYKNVSFYKMKGLSYEEYCKYYHSDKALDLTDRIRLINRFMKYELESDYQQKGCYDALKIAEILGLSSEFITDAQNILKENLCNPKEGNYEAGTKAKIKIGIV